MTYAVTQSVVMSLARIVQKRVNASSWFSALLAYSTLRGNIGICKSKNYKNQLRLAKVIVKNKLPRFNGSLCMQYPR